MMYLPVATGLLLSPGAAAMALMVVFELRDIGVE